MAARMYGDPPKPLAPMGPNHPMWERLQRQLARVGVTIELVTSQALMSWTCDQEVAEARLPRSWTIANLDEARQLVRTCRRGVEVEADANCIRLVHDHPFYGHIAIDAELANALFAGV